ncbi:MAG: hypothetical protein AAB834_07200, partial [Patescibacteria group bacterium]
MMSTVETPLLSIDEEFGQIWAANDMTNQQHPALAAGTEAHERLMKDPESGRSTLYITDVTLRDGQQQRTNEVTTAQRVEVFDRIVETGVDCIEIGHLGNSNGDQQLATAIVQHVAEREEQDERYANVKLQVLFGSQEELIKDGIRVLQDAFQAHYGEEWQEAMEDKVVVHVYDALDENLLATRSTPYGQQESARRVKAASQHALDAGFRRFSLTGEAATAASPEEAIQYYRSITQHLLARNTNSVNINLTNTYGFSANPEWNAHVLTEVNAGVKYGFPERRVTTSIHTHNDVASAADMSIAAIVAGIDRLEGTLDGMGERAGNVATITVVDRLLEAARHQHEEDIRAAEGKRS